MTNKIIEVVGLKKHFPIKGGIFKRTTGGVKAVDRIDFYINEGETLGLVGESGCGKTTVGRTILRLIEQSEGKIFFETVNLSELNKNEMRVLRSKMQIVFQDPFASLNPRMTIKKIVGEPLIINGVKGNELRRRVLELLEKVGLKEEHLNRFPHEFSGGQRQRIGVARALALNPKFIVLDEPTSALDVSVQAQVLNILKDLQKELGLTYLFISHDLSVIKHFCDRMAVMYLGKIVEMGRVNEIFENPLHPYTEALLSAIPVADPEYKSKRILLKGEVPSAVTPPRNCRFHTRCNYVFDLCKIGSNEIERNVKSLLNPKINPNNGFEYIDDIAIIDNSTLEVKVSKEIQKDSNYKNIENLKNSIKKLIEYSNDDRIAHILQANVNAGENKIILTVEPKLKDIGNKHYVACYLREDLDISKMKSNNVENVEKIE